MTPSAIGTVLLLIAVGLMGVFGGRRWTSRDSGTGTPLGCATMALAFLMCAAGIALMEAR